MKQKRLMIMAGGTGGHLFPGLAVAHHLMAEGWQIRWLGSADRMEADLIPKQGIEIDFIKITGLKGRKFTELLSAPLHIIAAIRQAKAVMQAYQPDAVLGMGGYVSGPGGIAAWLLGIPIVLHEQNAIAGLTNRWLAKVATRVLQAFPGALQRAEVVGNPLRTEVLALPEPKVRFFDRQGPIRVLVVGGSQGASVLNQILPKVAKQMGDKITLWHQVGKGNLAATCLAYKQLSAQTHRVVEFIDDMSAAYCWADMIICRSGALTVSEITAVGLPAIFVPFMHQDRQQYWNAFPLEEAAAAIIIEQPDFSADNLVKKLTKLDRLSLLAMATKAYKMRMVDATNKVASAICSVVRR